MNYAESLELSTRQEEVFKNMHLAVWDKKEKLDNGFFLKKILQSFNNFSPEEDYHLVYYDAFAPSRQPEMWTTSCFEKVYACMAEGGILVTYCAKGAVRRSMQSVGFNVERLPGPPGKREMLRAWK
jgi:tRNA U34 5-methylaminomethyl-2-thiouridine-forming methyltransferase MnmC